MKFQGKIRVLGKYEEDEKAIYIGDSDDELIETLEELDGKEVEVVITVKG